MHGADLALVLGVKVVEGGGGDGGRSRLVPHRSHVVPLAHGARVRWRVRRRLRDEAALVRRPAHVVALWESLVS